MNGIRKLYFYFLLLSCLVYGPAQAIEPLTACGIVILGWSGIKVYRYQQGQIKKYQEFFQIIEKGDLDAVINFFTAEKITLTKKINTRYALLVACENNHIKIAAWLCEQGVELVSVGSECLVAACNQGHKEMLAWLIGRGATGYSQDLNTCLLRAVEANNVAAVECSLIAGANPNAYHGTRDGLLMRAAMGGAFFPYYDFMRSAYNGSYRSSRYGNMVESFQKARRTTLLPDHTYQINSLEIVRLLLEMGANVNLENREGLSAFYCAVFVGNIEAMRLMYATGTVQFDKHDYLLGKIAVDGFLYDFSFFDVRKELEIMKEEVRRKRDDKKSVE
ncbi:MAG: ankyrin repeat domain-containing protein [Candidatus Babeliales bacterium]